MDPSPDQPIRIGRPHRTFRAVELLIYDYDELGVRTRVLPAGSVFQPWEPETHWRGVKVPVTLGDAATGFDWGATSAEGHFVSWHDFFTACGTGDAPARPGPAVERRLEPFAELVTIGARLRERTAGSRGDRPTLEALLSTLAALEQAHAHAARMELGASGFDNTESMHRYAAVQDHLLAAAREILKACRSLSG